MSLCVSPHVEFYALLNRKFQNLYHALHGPGNKSTQFFCDIPVIRLANDVKSDCELVLPLAKVVKNVRQYEFQESGALVVKAAKKLRQ